MSPGQFAYKYFFKPTLPLRYNLTHFGLAGLIKLKLGEAAMKKAAVKLKPITLSANFLLECSYLTGKKYWHQTAFCAYSLAKVLNGNIKIDIYSDGTLSEDHISVLKQILKNINIVDSTQITNSLEQLLPESRFPLLRSLREQNPFFRKLVDMRLNNNYVAQLDSDMLFFNVPTELINAYNTNTNYFMRDTLDSSFYVLPEKEIKESLDVDLRKKINSGIMAYNSGHIDWDYMETACKFLLSKVPATHPPMFEQTLNAILISKLNGEALNKNYKIFYDSVLAEIDNADIVRHYIFKAKLPYLTTEWKKIIH